MDVRRCDQDFGFRKRFHFQLYLGCDLAGGTGSNVRKVEC